MHSGGGLSPPPKKKNILIFILGGGCGPPLKSIQGLQIKNHIISIRNSSYIVHKTRVKKTERDRLFDLIVRNTNAITEQFVAHKVIYIHIKIYVYTHSSTYILAIKVAKYLPVAQHLADIIIKERSKHPKPLPSFSERCRQWVHN